MMERQRKRKQVRINNKRTRFTTLGSNDKMTQLGGNLDTAEPKYRYIVKEAFRP